MNSSYTTTESATFTITHANYIAAKVATDLKRMQRFYEQPVDSAIADFEAEIAILLKHGYLKKISYGFQKNGNWIEPTLIYTANELNAATDDDPGKIKPAKDISGANFYSLLEYSVSWHYSLSGEEKEIFKRGLPIQRGSGLALGINGYLDDDRTYSSGGKALSRSSVRSYT